ncbi:MAG: hypothetical protein IKD68_13955 [Solobacterium sp.]|nr:hypothetical protein [Solobacterium sp.]
MPRALDEVTKHRLLRNLRTLADKTVMIITHRIAASELCGRVLRYAKIRFLTAREIRTETGDERTKPR